MKFEVCHISGVGFISDWQVEEKLNEGWRPIGLDTNRANELLMYFQREKPTDKIDYFLNYPI